MSKQFTASEARDLAKRGRDAMQQFIDGRHTLHIPPQYHDADMVIAECLRAMDAYADRLEADEKAEPVAYAVLPSHRACVPYENHPGKRVVGFVIDESHPWWGKCGLTEPLSALEAALATQENPND